MSKKLTRDFYRRSALEVAPDLLGKVLVHHRYGQVYKARIVEVEAYLAEGDRASHTDNYKRTPRTEVLFGPPGHLYVYFTYGLHTLANIICNEEEIPEGVMLRGLEPLEGYEAMVKNRYGAIEKLSTYQRKNITNGPGKLTQAMAIDMEDYGADLTGDVIYVLDDGYREFTILQGSRIGVEYAGEDKDLPYRFFIQGNPHVREPHR